MRFSTGFVIAVVVSFGSLACSHSSGEGAQDGSRKLHLMQAPGGEATGAKHDDVHAPTIRLGTVETPTTTGAPATDDGSATPNKPNGPASIGGGPTSTSTGPFVGDTTEADVGHGVKNGSTGTFGTTGVTPGTSGAKPIPPAPPVYP